MPPDPEAFLRPLERQGMRLELAPMRRLLAALGDPQRHLPAVLVAGTNGKGSTAALLAAMAGAAGYRVGLYTSPHLEAVEERIRVDGRAIAAGELAALLAEVLGAAGAVPTYFEALTAAAFLHFRRLGLELAVVEVGLGGRLDATNTADPVLSLVTDLSLEHGEILGRTVAEIAREKAGIFRRGRPALAGALGPHAAGAVRAAAGAAGVPLVFVEDLVRVGAVEARGWEGQRVELSTAAGRLAIELSLLGEHQARNAALAAAAAVVLAERGWERLGPEAVAAGARRCRWPGRLEPVLLPGGKRVLLDAAHNPGGVASLLGFLTGPTAGVEAPPWDLLFGALDDKEVVRMLPPLAARAAAVTLTAPESPRALDPASLADLLPALDAAGGAEPPPAGIVGDPGAALATALAGPSPLLVVCGSIVLVGGVRSRLRRRFGVPAAARETEVWER